VELRTQFYRRIQQIDFIGTKSNKPFRFQFHGPEVVELTNFLFSDLIGRKARARITALLQSYTKPTSDPQEQAETAEKSRDTPDEFRNLFGTLSRALPSASKNRDSHMTYIHQMYNTLAFLEDYNTRRMQAINKDESFIAILDRYGLKAQAGWSVLVRFLKYFNQQIGWTKTEHRNFIQGAQALSTLTDEFGHGILVLLPPGSNRRYVFNVKQIQSRVILMYLS